MQLKLKMINCFHSPTFGLDLTRVNLLILLIIFIIFPMMACSSGGIASDSTGYILLPADRKTINALPKPKLQSVDMSGSCRDSSLLFDSESAKAAWPAPGYIMPLKNWAMYHAGSRVATSSPVCADNELSVKLWQSAIGTPITGRMSKRDVEEFVGLVDKNDPRYAHVAKVKKMTPEETSVDMFYSLAQKGDAKAQYRLGAVYEEQGNLKEANYWYTKAADQGLPLALEKLGRQPRNLSDHKVAGSANGWPHNSRPLPKRIIIENPGPNADPGIPVEEAKARMNAFVEQQRQDMYENQRLEAEQRARNEEENYRRQYEEWRQRSMQEEQ